MPAFYLPARAGEYQAAGRVIEDGHGAAEVEIIPCHVGCVVMYFDVVGDGEVALIKTYSAAVRARPHKGII